MRAPVLAALAIVSLVRQSPPSVVHPVPPAPIVYGTVRDSVTGAALANAAVVIQGGREGAMVDAGGRYRLVLSNAAPGQRVTLHARRIGYRLTTRDIVLRPDSTRVDFALPQMSARLEEVVTTAEGTSTVRIRGLSSTAVVAGATAANGAVTLGRNAPVAARDPNFDTEEYDVRAENDFVSVAANPRSTFSVDVDRASYSNVRRFINDGKLPPRGAVRVEELINYFPYDYAAPARTSATPIAITTEVAAAPWMPSHRVVRIGLQTPRIETAQLPPSNLVFLIDVSGSMWEPNKLPLVKSALRLLVAQLRPQDHVAIVVYASEAGLVLPSTSGAEKEKILDVLDRLEAGGSTAGGAGIRLAYDIANASFAPGGNNRVILATDGDFNVGVSSTSELVDLVSKRRARGNRAHRPRFRDGEPQGRAHGAAGRQRRRQLRVHREHRRSAEGARAGDGWHASSRSRRT